MKWIIVLGMHRSGTSAITRAIGLMGASTGEAASIGKHWENVPLRHMNERLLRAGGGRWDSPPPRGWLTTEPVQRMRTRAKEVLEREYPETENEIALWKDPRTCLVLPFWLDLLEGDPYFVVIYRHPTEVAASLTARNKFGEGLGYALWERYNADALAAIAGRPAVVVEYGRVVTAPEDVLSQVRSSLGELGLDLPNDPRTTDHGLVAQERHHTADAADAIGAIATPSQRELFERLHALEGSHAALPGPAEPPPQSQSSIDLLEVAGGVRRASAARRRARASALGPAVGETRAARRKLRRADRSSDESEVDPPAAGQPEPA